MRSVRSRWAAASVVLLAAGSAALAAQGTAHAVGVCPSLTSGVTVVVDFSAFGGGVQVGCAVGDPATGLAALHEAGFTTEGTARWGAAFVCRIDGLPAPAQQPCAGTPPADAYWAYWHASRGGSWRYSQLGAATRNPDPGSVEGWAFGAGPQPNIAPPVLPLPVPTDPVAIIPPITIPPGIIPPAANPPALGTATGQPPAKPSVQPAAPGSPPAAGAGGGAASSDPTAGAEPATQAAGSTTSADSGPLGSSSSAADRVGLPRDLSGGDTASRGVGGLVAGVALVVAVVAGAWWAAVRRRRATPPDG